MMERAEILTAMGELKLHGMKDAYDEIIATAVKRQHGPQHVVGDLLTAEIAEKQGKRSFMDLPDVQVLDVKIPEDPAKTERLK